MAVLGDVDGALGEEAAGGGAGGFHEGLPEFARRLGVVGGFGGGEGAGGFGGADGFARAALVEEVEDGLFELVVLCGRFVCAAGVGAEPDVVPVSFPLFAPGDGAAAGVAGLGCGAGGWFGFAVGHDGVLCEMRWAVLGGVRRPQPRAERGDWEIWWGEVARWDRGRTL